MASPRLATLILGVREVSEHLPVTSLPLPHSFKFLILYAGPPPHYLRMECPPQSEVNCLPFGANASTYVDGFIGCVPCSIGTIFTFLGKP